MKIVKLGKGGVLTSYICNCARKMRRLIVEQVHYDAEDLRKDNSYEIHFYSCIVLTTLETCGLGV